jgi:hypothetical protein
MKLQKNALFLTLALVFVLLAGCVVCKTDENFIGPKKSELKKIDYGETTKDQLIELFGEPAEQVVMQDGTEILMYKCVKTKDNAFVMFPPPIVIKDDKTERHVVAFELQDGIVQRYRTER